MRLFFHELRWEQKVFWRSRESAVFVFLFPMLLFALLTAVYTGHIYGHPASWALLAGMLGYGAANTAFAGLTLILVARRETRDPQADPRDAVAARDLSRSDVDVDHDRLRASGGRRSSSSASC